MDDDIEPHSRVMETAKFVALACVASWSIGLNAQAVHMPRHRVDLAGEAGYPEGVDDVLAGDQDVDRSARLARLDDGLFAGFLDRVFDLFLGLLDHLLDAGRVDTAVREELGKGDAGYLARWIGQSSGHRRRALEAQFDQRPEELYRVQVHVPDRPGVFAGITQALGAARINIEDFELHHFTPERGGTVELLVAGREAAEAAVELLDAQGYGALAAPVLADAT